MPHSFHDNCGNQGFLLPKKCSKTKTACRDKNVARVTNRHISSASPNNQPLGDYWGLRTPAAHHSGVTRPLQTLGSDQLGQISSNCTWASPKVKLSCRSVLVDTLFFCFSFGGERERREHPGQERAYRDVLWESSSLPVVTAAQQLLWCGAMAPTLDPACLSLCTESMVVTASVVHIAATKFLCARGKLKS